VKTPSAEAAVVEKAERLGVNSLTKDEIRIYTASSTKDLTAGFRMANATSTSNDADASGSPPKLVAPKPVATLTRKSSNSKLTPSPALPGSTAASITVPKTLTKTGSEKFSVRAPSSVGESSSGHKMLTKTGSDKALARPSSAAGELTTAAKSLTKTGSDKALAKGSVYELAVKAAADSSKSRKQESSSSTAKTSPKPPRSPAISESAGLAAHSTQMAVISPDIEARFSTGAANSARVAKVKSSTNSSQIAGIASDMQSKLTIGEAAQTRVPIKPMAVRTVSKDSPAAASGASNTEGAKSPTDPSQPVPSPRSPRSPNSKVILKRPQFGQGGSSRKLFSGSEATDRK
jgi:hypothetical protein